MRATSSTTVQASVDHVWDVLADHEGMSAWAPGLKARLTNPGTSEKNGVGAVRKIGFGFAGPIKEEIVAFEPGKLLRYKALAGVPLKNYFGEVELTAVAGGTRIDYSVSVDERIPGLDRTMAKVISKTLLGALARRARATA
ncbi:MAG TPA: SRPBCC family protein [Nocardioidaceae bacterium]|nr:SRPBCC family protein [Nocardioidaceae bacterium]